MSLLCICYDVGFSDDVRLSNDSIVIGFRLARVFDTGHEVFSKQAKTKGAVGGEKVGTGSNEGKQRGKGSEPLRFLVDHERERDVRFPNGEDEVVCESTCAC